MLSPEFDPRLRSPWGPVRTSVGWWAKPVSEAVINDHVVDAETGRLDAVFGKYLADDMIGRALALMGGSLSDEGQDPLVIGRAQATMMRLRLLAPAWAHYVACGQQLLDFSPELVKILGHKEIRRASRLSDYRNLFRSFYVRFGPQLHLGLPWENRAEFVDGAFVSFVRDTNSEHPSIVIGLTMIFPDGAGSLAQGPVLRIDAKHFDQPVETALRNAIADVEILGRQLHATVSREPLGPLANLGAGVQAECRELEDIFRRALPLLCNSLAFLSATPVADAAPSSDTPRELSTAVLDAPTPDARAAAIATLIERGYPMVRPYGSQDEGASTAAG